MKKNITNIIMILLGNLILVLGVATFILPFNILSGGVAGIAVAVSPFLRIDREIIINSVIIFFFILGWIILGKQFAMQTMVSSIAYPVILTIVTPYIPKLEMDPILASLYAGLVCGCGIGLVMRCNASTGGMDIPPMIFNKLFGIKISTSVLFIDTATVLLGVVAYDLPAVLLGLISVFTTSFAIDKVLSFGGQSSKAVWIISGEYEKIINEIQHDLDRGATIADAQGGYTGEKRKVVLCVVNSSQYPKLIEIINKFDEKAFILTTDATDVHGEGFSFGFRV